MYAHPAVDSLYMHRAQDGNWIETYTGGAFWPVDPRASEINIFDIAHSLALSCRWTGHVRRHYSIGQHSVLVSYDVPQEFALHGLLHDASEAYVSDIARPTKRQLQNYAEIEDRLLRTILTRFGLSPALPRAVKISDNRLLFAEARDLMRRPPMEWTDVRPAGGEHPKVRPWPMWWTEIRFLWRFACLTNTRKETVAGYLKHKLIDLFGGK